MSPSLRAWELGLRGPRSYLLEWSDPQASIPSPGQKVCCTQWRTAGSGGAVGCGGGILRVEDLRGREKPMGGQQTSQGWQLSPLRRALCQGERQETRAAPGSPGHVHTHLGPCRRCRWAPALGTGEPWAPMSVGAQRRGSQGRSIRGKQRVPRRPCRWGLLGRRTGGL